MFRMGSYETFINLIESVRKGREVDSGRIAEVLLECIPPQTDEEEDKDAPVVSPLQEARIARMNLQELEVLRECLDALRAQIQKIRKKRLN